MDNGDKLFRLYEEINFNISGNISDLL